jgi:hypothetical protein
MTISGRRKALSNVDALAIVDTNPTTGSIFVKTRAGVPLATIFCRCFIWGVGTNGL